MCLPELFRLFEPQSSSSQPTIVIQTQTPLTVAVEIFFRVFPTAGLVTSAALFLVTKHPVFLLSTLVFAVWTLENIAAFCNSLSRRSASHIGNLGLNRFPPPQRQNPPTIVIQQVPQPVPYNLNPHSLYPPVPKSTQHAAVGRNEQQRRDRSAAQPAQTPLSTLPTLTQHAPIGRDEGRRQAAAGVPQPISLPTLQRGLQDTTPRASVGRNDDQYRMPSILHVPQPEFHSEPSPPPPVHVPVGRDEEQRATIQQPPQEDPNARASVGRRRPDEEPSQTDGSGAHASVGRR